MYHFPLFFQGIQTVPVFLHVFMWYLELFLFWGHTLSCLVRECFTFLYSMLFINDLWDRSTCTLKKKVKAIMILNFDLALNDNINEWMKTQKFFLWLSRDSAVPVWEWSDRQHLHGHVLREVYRVSERAPHSLPTQSQLCR